MLQNANLAGVNLNATDFSSTNLQGAVLRNVRAIKTNFDGAGLTGTDTRNTPHRKGR